MRKKHLVFNLINMLVIATHVNCIQIDNQLVSAQHGEFFNYKFLFCDTFILHAKRESFKLPKRLMFKLIGQPALINVTINTGRISDIYNLIFRHCLLAHHSDALSLNYLNDNNSLR